MPLVRIRNLVRAAAAAIGPILMVTLCCYAFVILEALSCSCVIQREFTLGVRNAPIVAELRGFFNVVVALIVTVTSSAVAVGDLNPVHSSGNETGNHFWALTSSVGAGVGEGLGAKEGVAVGAGVGLGVGVGVGESVGVGVGLGVGR